ncbi:translocon associated complex TRAP delta-subunit-like protein [Dinothrombium tinctorium]|uniref:Translocon-associated protein subunit delta n=1 Tax=Dinothrombium tinctorium TaxID=1965070 RepID=A0A443QFP4_9ACAR|nr:translocon associated complex TRAP delta-subunit-like protein [Dinothrombium tinctorium]RWS02335.1 translocon associated complex TRAP delta-subunit-like protein [Dinothrombium tinctorium]
MALFLSHNLLWIEWISFSASVSVLGFLVLYYSKAVPEAFQRIFKYGKLHAKLHEDAMKKFRKVELPKRRLSECIFLSVYSDGKIHVIHYVIGFSFYFGVGLSLLAEAPGFEGKGLCLFVWSSRLQNQSHAILAELRKDSKGCEVKEVKSNEYSTTDGMVVASNAYIVTFTVKCKDVIATDSLTLFADIPSLNKQLPVVKASNGEHYQVSWTEDVNKASSASYEIRVYDEERFAQFRRAQRKESKEEVKPLLTLTLNHYGTYKGPYIQTEMVAAILAIALYWFAYTNKSKLVA